MDEILPFPVIRDIAIVTVLLGIGLYVYTTRGFHYFRKSGVRHLPPLPLVGNLSGYLTGRLSLCQVNKEVYDAFPDQKLVGHFTFTTPFLIIRDPDTLRQVLIRDFEHFTDHVVNIDETLDPLFGRTLHELRGNKWRTMRTTVSPAFSTSKIMGMFPLLVKCCENMVSYIDSNITSGRFLVDAEEFFNRVNFQVIASVALGVEVDMFENRDEEFFLRLQTVSSFAGLQAAKMILISFFPRLTKFLQMKIMNEDTSKYFRSIIRDTISSREENDIVRPDMIQLLIQAKKGTLKDDDLGVTATRNKDLTDDDITSQAMIFLVAGSCSTTSLMSFMAYEIARNSEVQQRLLREVDEVARATPMGVTYEAIDKMQYLDMVISESLRLWPFCDTDRKCVKPYTITDKKNGIHHEVKVGDMIMIPIFALHRDPNYFPDPEKFDPERFSEERKKSIIPNTYIPFGLGPRKCIGIQFITILAKLTIFSILSKYTIHVSPKTIEPIEIESSIIMKAKGGLWLNLKPRDDK